MVQYYHQSKCNISANLFKGNSVFYVDVKEYNFTCWEEYFIWMHFSNVSGLSLLEYFRSIGAYETKQIREDLRFQDSIERQDILSREALKDLWERERKLSPNLPFPDFLQQHIQKMNKHYVSIGLSNLSAMKDDRRKLSYQKKAAHYSLKI